MYPFLFILGVLLLPKVLGLTAPFIVGFFIYLLCRKAVRRLSVLGMRRGLASFFVLSFAAALILGLAALIFSAVYAEAEHLPQLYAKISAIEPQNELLRKFISAFKGELSDALRTISVKLVSYLGDVTNILMLIAFAVLSAFFFLKDEEKIVDIILRIGGDGFVKKLQSLRPLLCGALSGYIRAQSILMALNFAVLSVFLVLFGVNGAVLIAMGIAFVDAIPVLGTGTVLLPWAAYEFLCGGTALGFGLLALYGVCSLMRQILEPKILSSQLGLHPLLTLAGVYVGFKLLGFWGLIAGPIFVLIFVTYIQNRGQNF